MQNMDEELTTFLFLMEAKLLHELAQKRTPPNREEPLRAHKVNNHNHRMIEDGRTPGSLLVQTPAHTGPPRTGCTGPCPRGFWRSPRWETPQ